MSTHNYNCNHCKFKFSFESDKANEPEFAKEMGGINCPKCKRKRGENGVNITHDFMVPGGIKNRGTRDINTMRKLNREQSVNATRQAAQYRADNPDEFAQVAVKRPKDMPSQGPIKQGNPVENIPKRVIDGLSAIAEAGMNKE